MTTRIREFLQASHRRRTLPRRRPRCRARQLSELCQGAAGQQSVLCREGQSGAGDPHAPGRARLLLRRRLGQRDPDVLAAGATPDRISYRQHHQEGERDRAAFELGVTLFAVDCEAEVEKVARAAPGSRVILPHPLRRLRLRVAAVAKIRLRTGLCRRHSGARAPARARCRMASRSMSARSSTMSRPGTGRWRRPRRSSAPAPSAASRSPWSISAAASRPNTSARRRQLESYGKAIFRVAAQALWQQPAEHHRRAGPRSRRQCRHHRGRGGADRQAQPRGRGALGLSRHRQVPRSRRDHRTNSIRYPIRTSKDRDETAPCIIAGPTCDSVDVLYEKTPYPLPVSRPSATRC